MIRILHAAALAATICAQPALAAAPGAPIKITDTVTLDPILEARLRYEGVDTPTLNGDGMTLRLRAGVEGTHRSGLAFLAEVEGSAAIANNYNAFPFVVASSQRRTAYATIPDPMTIEMNRLQLQYRSKPFTLTLGRQRINLDDQRFVGSVGWRQNEQTFDAVRAEATAGPLDLDATYAVAQRTIFGIDAGPRQSYDGDFAFLSASTKIGPIQAKAFAYLLDYAAKDQIGPLGLSNADTQTYGVRATSSFAVAKATKLSVAASVARQSSWHGNPADYDVTYFAGEGSLATGRLAATAGYERLGGTGTRAFQTPMATLHKFNGWADLFLVTPAAGLEDVYAGATFKFPSVKVLPGLAASITGHRFSAAQGNSHFGNEIDASVGFKRGAMSVLAKFADYRARAFGTDTRKFWLQMELAY